MPFLLRACLTFIGAVALVGAAVDHGVTARAATREVFSSLDVGANSESARTHYFGDVMKEIRGGWPV
jgi:hypothetical protein